MALSNENYEYLERIAPPLVAGSLAFYATLGLSTFLQLHVLRVSTGSMAPLPSLLGVGTVAFASVASHVASVKGYYEVNKKENTDAARYSWSNKNGYGSLIPPDFFTVPFNFEMDRANVNHLIRVCVVGLLAYKGLGGRFWSISPSSYTKLGSFARTFTSLPATSAYANKSERRSIQRLGRILGCHTCGSRMILSSFSLSHSNKNTQFIGDHMPPQSVAKQMNAKWFRRWFGSTVMQRFYPHCNKCSNRQGSILSVAVNKAKGPSLWRAGGGKNAYFHGFVPRIGHLAGGVIAAATVVGSDGDEVLRNGGGNRWRFFEWQRNFEDSCCELREYIERFQK